ncbi:MAG: (2Fe-2S)-binding protein [Myxococcales bacterium]|nr:(2Fe-2S)-binding protein [Myxococcales bacterium]
MSDRSVRLAVMQGARSVNEIGDACGAGTDCGACHEQLDQMASSANSSSSSTAGRCHAVPSGVGSTNP